MVKRIPSHYGKIKPKGVRGSEVPWPPPVGAEVRIVYGEGNFNNRAYHVRAHVEPYLIAVAHYKFGGKKGWAHSFIDDYWWESNEERVTVVLPKVKQGPEAIYAELTELQGVLLGLRAAPEGVEITDEMEIILRNDDGSEFTRMTKAKMEARVKELYEAVHNHKEPTYEV